MERNVIAAAMDRNSAVRSPKWTRQRQEKGKKDKLPRDSVEMFH